jgi:hypothetical protein
MGIGPNEAQTHHFFFNSNSRKYYDHNLIIMDLSAHLHRKALVMSDEPARKYGQEEESSLSSRSWYDSNKVLTIENLTCSLKLIVVWVESYGVFEELAHESLTGG